MSREMSREEKSIKIAKFEGWEYVKGKHASMRISSRICSTAKLKVLFKMFNGLMPIVGKINKDRNNLYDIEIGWQGVDVLKGNLLNATYIYTDSLTLLDALQDAIIHYYEDRGK